MTIELGTTIAGVSLPFCVMNAAGTAQSTEDVRQLLGSRTGAIVLHPVTMHPFVHPSFRSMNNPGYDKLIPLIGQVVEAGKAPVIAAVAGSTIDEFAFLARVLAEAGAAIIELSLAEPWVEASLAPFEDPTVLRDLLTRTVAACTVPVSVRLPDQRALPDGRLIEEFAMAGVRVVVISHDFIGLEKFRLEAGDSFDLIALGDIGSGWEVSRLLEKGARAVQVTTPMTREGPPLFARLERELRKALGDRP